MNRIQTFSLFVGTIVFIFAGVLLESLRYTCDRTLWPSIGDVIVILFLVALFTAGLFWIFIERWRIWPILLSTIIGLILGTLSYFLFMQFAPEYTASAFIKVLPPADKGPMTMASVQVDRDVLYRQCLAMTKLITQQSMFDKLIRVDAARSTKWFSDSHKADVVAAMEDLKDNLIATAQRDSDYIAVSMTCHSAEESALILNSMVDLFIKDQQANTSSDILGQLAGLRTQQKSIEDELRTVQAALDELRVAAAREDITGLEESAFENPISQRLVNLQSECDKLIDQVKQAESVLGNLQQQADDPNNAQLALQIEDYIKSDPVVVTLNQQLILNELELAEKTAGSNSKSADSQAERVIKVIRGKIAERKASIRDTIKRANHENAQNQLVNLRFRLIEVQNMLAEAGAKKKDLDAQRSRYEILANLRDERQKRLDEIKILIEKVNMMRTDPEAAKVIKVGDAPEPLEASFPRLEIFLPSGTVLGFIIGAGISLFIRKANEQNIAKDS